MCLQYKNARKRTEYPFLFHSCLILSAVRGIDEVKDRVFSEQDTGVVPEAGTVGKR